jgi:hypothetical protein
LGLILLMFLMGLEFDFSHLSENRAAALSIRPREWRSPSGWVCCWVTSCTRHSV